MHWRCRDLQVRPLKQPAKRQRLHKKTDSAELKATLGQGMLRSVMSYLRGGPLNTIAAKVMLQNIFEWCVQQVPAVAQQHVWVRLAEYPGRLNEYQLFQPVWTLPS